MRRAWMSVCAALAVVASGSGGGCAEPHGPSEPAARSSMPAVAPKLPAHVARLPAVRSNQTDNLRLLPSADGVLVVATYFGGGSTKGTGLPHLHVGRRRPEQPGPREQTGRRRSPVADRLGRSVSDSLASGGTRPEWCRSASSADAGLLAAHAFWSRTPADPPVLVDLLGHRDRAAATALLRHDLEWLAVDAMDCQVVIADDADDALRRLRTAEAGMLVDAGFRAVVERIRVEWLRAVGCPSVAQSLRMRPASQVATDDLVALFAGVGDGSLDAGMIADRARLGRTGAARDRLARRTAMRHEDGWFAVGVDPRGNAVGYVLAALVDGNRPVLAEIGVAESARGRRLVDELLAHGTRVLAEHGALQIRGDVDAANRPMRAAFSRAGYREFATRQDYRWIRG